MKRIALISAATLFVGCASVTDVVSTGSDTYMVASQGVIGNGSGAAQLAAAFKAAGTYCNARGEQMQSIRSDQTEPFFGRAPSGKVEFRCVKTGDALHK